MAREARVTAWHGFQVNHSGVDEVVYPSALYTGNLCPCLPLAFQCTRYANSEQGLLASQPESSTSCRAATTQVLCRRVENSAIRMQDTWETTLNVHWHRAFHTSIPDSGHLNNFTVNIPGENSVHNRNTESPQ